jgi:hypothetical protein
VGSAALVWALAGSGQTDHSSTAAARLTNTVMTFLSIVMMNPSNERRMTLDESDGQFLLS